MVQLSENISPDPSQCFPFGAPIHMHIALSRPSWLLPLGLTRQASIDGQALEADMHLPSERASPS